MTQAIQEGQLLFTFSDSAEVSQYDDWSFYRNQFNPCFGGTKAVDFVLHENGTAWLIEVKDYRRHVRTKPIDLASEVAEKVRDTLAGLVAAQANANADTEKSLAQSLVRSNKLRVVLHLEQPLKPSRLFPAAINPANVLSKLRKLVRSVDAHPLIVDSSNLEKFGLSWKVTGHTS